MEISESVKIKPTLLCHFLCIAVTSLVCFILIPGAIFYTLKYFGDNLNNYIILFLIVLGISTVFIFSEFIHAFSILENIIIRNIDLETLKKYSWTKYFFYIPEQK